MQFDGTFVYCLLIYSFFRIWQFYVFLHIIRLILFYLPLTPSIFHLIHTNFFYIFSLYKNKMIFGQNLFVSSQLPFQHVLIWNKYGSQQDKNWYVWLHFLLPWQLIFLSFHIIFWFLKIDFWYNNPDNGIIWLLPVPIPSLSWMHPGPKFDGNPELHPFARGHGPIRETWPESHG